MMRLRSDGGSGGGGGGDDESFLRLPIRYDGGVRARAAAAVHQIDSITSRAREICLNNLQRPIGY